MAEGPSETILARLIRDHYAFVFRYGYRLCGRKDDAEDLCQQTFLAACEHWDQLRDPEAARGWLCSIARNTYLRNCRKSLRTLPMEEWDEPDKPPSPSDPIDPDELQGVLNQLPEEFRSPIVLFYFREMSYKEIAATLDIPLGTVMSRLARGKRWLREKLTLGTSPESRPGCSQT